uniref:Glycosyl transferase 64 domain-containing protein n=1 Tax=Acrobeloides nanus TaxID=290746 RepID=A0A914CGB0_9BILA
MPIKVDGPEKACLFVLLATSNKQQDFNKLAFWSENGENNLIIFIDEPKEAIDVGDAMVVSSDFSSRIYRHHMDLALYLKVLPYSIDQWKNYPILIDEVPRPYLFSFATTAYGLTDIEKRILDRLQNFCTEFFQNKCLIEIVSEDNTWERCQLIENTQTRETINRNSTFVILFTKCPSFQQRLFETYTIWNSDPTHLETDHISPLGTILYPSGSDSLIPGLKTSHLPSDSSYHNILGGSQPDENYTIIMLAYKRDEQIKIAVNRMNDLKFLDRVIVVWNDVKREPPLSDWWPILHVPLFIVNGTKNSLNNRFLPYDLIRTEAVFNMDDDFEATNEYIGLMFRVWRENRDVIVGPNFRLGYIENTGGKYGGPNKCEYNMVLTSAAFIHRSYLYAYTYLMPEAIRTKIDELINCEDIAVNFLVSHLTRKPPIKATPIRNSVGSKAAGGLSTRGSHYTKRAECIKFFTEVYGYNPLISSQFRADSLSYGFGYGQHCFKSTK